MKVGTIKAGPLAGMAKAKVFRSEHHEIPYPFAKGVIWPVFVAKHECGWAESCTAWHNAFWAADHHVRYDCGRREQPSSGGYVTPLLADGTLDMGAMHGLKPGLPWVDEPHQVRPIGEHEAEFIRRWNEGAPHRVGPVLGGMQNDPTPTHMPDPPPPGYAEVSTVELGAITAEMGAVEWEGRHLEGWSEGASGGSTGWWARVRGRHGRQR